jgi:uncharacterized protein (DUF58 family)
MPTLFDSEFLKKLEYLNLIARRLVFGRRQALRQSVKKGASIEFKDFREYSPGDDLRSVDWMAYARLDQLFVKLYRQEEELDLWVLLDTSGSMDFGDPNKFDHARRIAAALSYIGMANMDSASVVPFGEGLGDGRTRLRGRGNIFRLLTWLEELKPGGDTDFEQTVRKFLSVVRKQSLVVIVSDFYGLDRARKALDRMRYFRHQMHVIQMIAPWERDPPIRGELRLVDMESSGHADLTVTDTMLKRYKKAFEQQAEDLKRYSMRYSIGFDQAHTDVAFDHFLRGVLEHGRLLA